MEAYAVVSYSGRIFYPDQRSGHSIGQSYPQSLIRITWTRDFSYDLRAYLPASLDKNQVASIGTTSSEFFDNSCAFNHSPEQSKGALSEEVAVEYGLAVTVFR